MVTPLNSRTCVNSAVNKQTYGEWTESSFIPSVRQYEDVIIHQIVMHSSFKMIAVVHSVSMKHYDGP
jgi:hypothetical protein